MRRRRCFAGSGRASCVIASCLVLCSLFLAIPSAGQGGAVPRTAPQTNPVPALSAAREAMAGSLLQVFVSRLPAGETRLAVVQAGAADEALIGGALAIGAAQAQVPLPGLSGAYELRLLERREAGIAVLARQPLRLTPPSATVAAPASVKPGANIPVRGIGPQGPNDFVTLVPADAPPEVRESYFLPIDNAEATLEAPRAPGSYELRYVMDAPLSRGVVLARQRVEVLR